MRARPAFLGFSLLLSSAAACASGAGAAARPPSAEAPAAVDDLDAFEVSLNRFVLRAADDPEREAHRRLLLEFLVQYIDRTLKEGQEAEAGRALEYAVGLYTPRELRSASAEPALAARARKVYASVARRGAEDPALFALAVEQRFGEERQRQHAVHSWREVEQWVTENAAYSSEPLLRHEELEQALEQVAAVFPTPFVVKRLSDLYLARYETARASKHRGRSIGAAAARRIEISGYLLMRLYLRADDLDSAIAVTQQVELEPPLRKLRELLVQAKDAKRSALPLLALAEQFIPQEQDELAQPFVTQGWAIAENIAHRALERFPEDAYVHLLRARTLTYRGLVNAAIVHLRRTIDLDEDIFEAWEALAHLEQRHVEELAEDDPKAAEAYLSQIEALHKRAAKQWSDRPIQPGLPEAFFAVAQGLYHAGEVDRAQGLLERSVDIEPVPRSLDLLGTIALKRSHLDQAKRRYENLARMPHPNEMAQLRWEARASRQLGEIAMRRGETASSTNHIRLALRHINALLAQAGALDEPERAYRLVERGQLLFTLGEIELGMEDFRRAAETAPYIGSVYADPLRFVVAHGYYEEAKQIYRRAMAQKDLSHNLKLYFSLWLNEMAARQGVAPEPEATKFLASYEGDRWGQTLAAHARGDLPFQELLSKANNKGEQAEAYFYEGMRRWHAGDEQAAKELLEQVIESDMMAFFEYDMARSYLDWGEVPHHARPALPPARADGSIAEPRP